MKISNKKELILAILSIFILAAVITGVTFAYFSASTTSDRDISGKTYNFSMSLTVTKVNPSQTPLKGDKLIPLTETDIDKAVSAGCVDKNNFAVCNIYELTFQNNASEAVTMSGNLTATENNYRSIYYNVTAVGASKDTLTTGTAINGLDPVTTGLTNLIVPAGESKMYLILYIKNDINANQPNDQNKSYSGVLTLYDARSNSGKVQATFTVS